MPITVRPACADDASDIGKLAQQFAEYLRELGDQTEFKLNAETYLRDGFGKQPAFLGIVAENGERVIGYLLYHFGYDSDAASRNLHIVDLYVDREMRNKGAGTALMGAAAGIAVKGGAQELIWSVYRLNSLAASFYEGLGAQRITEVFFMKLSRNALEAGP
jgi:ribosomal protein S18 acetylase RimI-like enzyme